MRFRTPAFAFIVEAFTHKHKNAKGEVEPATIVVKESTLVTEEKALPSAPVAAVPKAPKSRAVLDSYKVDGEVAKYLSEQDIQDLKEAFSLFDLDGDGIVTALDLGRVMHSLGQDANYSELLTMIKEVDENGNGTIDFPEFLAMMAKSAKADKEDVELRNAFKLFDMNADGVIDVEELRYVVHTLGNEVTEEEAAVILKEHDLDGDGKINYEEFVLMMTSQ